MERYLLSAWRADRRLLQSERWLPFAVIVSKTLIDVGERSGQLRPYVRPVTRHWPLAIMGVRVRVRHQSDWRARGTRLLAVLPDIDYRVFPITLLRLPAGSVGFAPVACHPTGQRHAAARATAATPPFER
jgi:hypothetical protein